MSSKRMLRNALFAIKSETNYGVDAFGGGAPGADDFVCIMNPSIQSRRVYVENDCVRPWHSGVAHESFGSHTEVSFELPLQGKTGIAGTLPPLPLVAAMKAAGHKFTESVGVSQQASPVTQHSMLVAPSCSIYAAFYWSDGTVSVQRVLGVRLTMTLRASGETPVILAFEGKGLYSELASDTSAAPAHPAAFSGNKPHFLSNGLALQVEGSTFRIRSLELVLGWDNENDDSIVGSSAIEGFHLVRSSRVAGSLEFTNHAEFKVALDASRADTVLTFDGDWTSGSDSVNLAMEIQFGDPEMSAGTVFSFPCSFSCVVTPALPETDYLLTWT